jgi:hypothetical protein
MWRHL